MPIAPGTSNGGSVTTDSRRGVLRVAAAWAAGLLAPAASARAVRASGAASQSLNPVDREFLRRATAFGATEHALARIAVRQGRSERVRDFARRLLADHDTLHVALRRIAAGRRLAATKVADPATLRRLRALKGAAFDREYMARMYRDKREAVMLFQKEAREGADLELKAFASRTLPIQRAHLKLAQQGDGAWRAVAITPDAAR